MRILVLGINYAPERSGVAPFTTGLCEHLAKQGHEVVVVTTFPYYPEWRVWDGFKGSLHTKSRVNGVTLHRVWQFVPRCPSNLFQRMLYHLSFTVSAFLCALFTEKCDIIYCSCPPAELGLAAYILGKLKRVPFVIKITDLASDAALATGIVREGIVIRIARALEKFMHKRATTTICLCQGFIDRLTERGIPPERLLLIPDWGDTENIFPGERVDGFRTEHGLGAEEFVVLHTGNMGKKQGLMNLVQAAELAKGERNLVWLIVGQGEERSALEATIQKRELTNIRLLPFQPKENLAKMYSAADVLIVNQKAAVKDAVIPSKLLTYMAAGRSVVAAVAERSEAARHVTRSKCGVVVPPEDPGALTAAVLRLCRDRELRSNLGFNGRRYAEDHFTKDKVMYQYDQFFKLIGERDYVHEK
jgi:colanic acid biosynthesis glycosyl transferase WcaI